MLEDYRAGLGVDRWAAEADREVGPKISCPVLALWSTRDDLEDLYGDPVAVWKPRCDQVSGHGIDSTHHVAEAGVVLDAADPKVLGRFYRRLLGWEMVECDDHWVQLRGPDGSSRLSFQREPKHRPPAWPSEADGQQMQIHLDFEVPDLEAAQQKALDAGATLMDWQPQKEGVRIMADPAGHIFCLFLPGW